ncbi:cold-shock protein [Paracoccus pacificus]|uniref:Cold-shock protein n=1 Tax=Paracoccus pacificus TaxID=1463598 RepID=A0ABW4R2D6_9RHOB
MSESDNGSRKISGLIKWFDSKKGFGFIVDHAGGSDVLLHANVLRSFGQSSVAEGARIEAMAAPSARGWQAIEVLSILPPESDTPAPLIDLMSSGAEEIEKLPVLPARVKWFDPFKGFGFANVFGESEDIFLHIEVLRHSGFANLVAGEAIGMKVVHGKRGAMAAAVFSWEWILTHANATGSGSGGGGADVSGGGGQATGGAGDTGPAEQKPAGRSDVARIAGLGGRPPLCIQSPVQVSEISFG